MPQTERTIPDRVGAEAQAVLGSQAAREIAQRILSPLSICSAAVAGYRAELRQVLDAEAIYLGVSK